jgi:hypothetical protein
MLHGGHFTVAEFWRGTGLAAARLVIVLLDIQIYV